MSAPVNVPLNSRGKLASSLPAEQVAEIAELFDFRRVGYSLDAPFYTDPTIFGIDMEAIFGQHWIFAASITELPEPGDYVTVDYGPYSLIVLRNDDGGVNVLHNVCRHRGARVLTEPAGPRATWYAAITPGPTPRTAIDPRLGAGGNEVRQGLLRPQAQPQC